MPVPESLTNELNWRINHDCHDPLLKIRFDGEAVGPGTIPVAHLRRFLDGMTKALQRTGRVLLREAESMRRGPHPRSVKDEVALDLVMVTQGSPAAVLGFERRQTETSLPGIDLGMEILEKSITSLEVVQKADAPLPPGYNAGYVLRFPLETAKGSATILSAWIIRHGEDFPRLTTCYIV